MSYSAYKIQSTKAPTILIVEDDEVIFSELSVLFTKNGYTVLDGNDFKNLDGKYDAAVLDICLPQRSGYEICMHIRKTKKCPILFLTSMDKPESELKAFNVGGDDFIRKPFNSSVLLARIARLLQTSAPIGELTRGSLQLDTIKLEVINGSQKIPLSKTEFAILKILMQTDGIIGKKEFIEKLWDNESYVDENTLYVNINRLREKLNGIGLAGAIKNVRGAGYTMGEE